MKLIFSEEAKKHLDKKKMKRLTIDLEEIQSPCCVGRLPEIKFSSHKPDRPDEYRIFTALGVEVFISKLLRTTSQVTLSLSGFGPFKKLEIDGVDLIL